MLEFWAELFLSSHKIYAILMIVLLLLFVVYTLFVVASVLAHYKVSRFFKRHHVENGKVIKYEIIKGPVYSTLSPMAPGVIPAVIPHIHQGSDQHSIILECCCSDERFLATYWISTDDYKERTAGEIVQIEKDWEPIDFQRL